jgi:hypothetical protein
VVTEDLTVPEMDGDESVSVTVPRFATATLLTNTVFADAAFGCPFQYCPP